jgi:hypothetical protein
MMNRDLGSGYPEQPLDDPDWDQDEQLNERLPVAPVALDMRKVPHDTSGWLAIAQKVDAVRWHRVRLLAPLYGL